MCKNIEKGLYVSDGGDKKNLLVLYSYIASIFAMAPWGVGAWFRTYPNVEHSILYLFAPDWMVFR